MHPSEAIKASEGEELLGKTVVLAVCGSIAAVEAVKLARELIRHGADLRPVMSEASRWILHPNALEFATGRKPITSLDGSVQHVDLCGARGEADLLLIAPATANTVSKMAHGIDDTPVTTFATTALGAGLPVMVAPAMDASMYAHPAIRENVEKLRTLGVEFVDPLLEEGKAKLAEVEVVAARVMRRLGPQDMKGQRVLVIAGASEEPLDDVRVLSAVSSGETGVELARAAFLRGAEVDLWMGRSTHPIPPFLRPWRFRTLEELTTKAGEVKHDVVAVPAALSDYVPERQEGKIPSTQDSLTVELMPGPRILAHLRKASSGTLVGFKLESGVGADELVKRASARLGELDLDFIVGNDVEVVKAGATEVVLVDRKGRSQGFKGTKRAVADALWSAILHGLEG